MHCARAVSLVSDNFLNPIFSSARIAWIAPSRRSAAIRRSGASSRNQRPG